MSLESDITKHKETQEGYKNIAGLVSLTVAIIFVFSILNIFTFGERDKAKDSDKSGGINTKVLSSLPKGRLNFFESSDGYQLSASEYEAVCKNTKIVAQRAMMGALITNINAQKLYTDNGNKIDKFSVSWDASSNKCFADYTIRAMQGTSDTITVSGHAKGFFNTGVDTRVYFIKNF